MTRLRRGAHSRTGTNHDRRRTAVLDHSRRACAAEAAHADKGEEMTTVSDQTDGRWLDLADGNRIPRLGLGVWQVDNGRECIDAVRWALELGYRHVDTAQAYGNEESVGRALRDSGVPRGEVFITTKFYPGRKDPVAEAEQSLRRLGVDQ